MDNEIEVSEIETCERCGRELGAGEECIETCDNCNAEFPCGERNCGCEFCETCDRYVDSLCGCCSGRRNRLPQCRGCCDHGHCDCGCGGCFDGGTCECHTCEHCGECYGDDGGCTLNCSTGDCDCCDRCSDCCNCECQCDDDDGDHNSDDADGEPHSMHARRPSRESFFHRYELRFWSPKRTELKELNSRRFAATEIEVAGADGHANTQRVTERWRASVVEDGSLPSTGFEINTAPAAGDLLVRQVTEICDALHEDGAYVNTACGLHVHIDARDFRYFDIRNLVAVYAKIEDAVFSAIAPSRSHNSMCTRCGRVYEEQIARGVKPSKKLREDVIKSVYGEDATDTYNTYDEDGRRKRVALYESQKREHRAGNRYYALNLHSFFHRGTVEFRMHHGTANAAKILGWLRVWIEVMDYVARVRPRELETALNVSDEDRLTFANAHALRTFQPATATGYVILSRILKPATFEYFMSRVRRFAK